MIKHWISAAVLLAVATAATESRAALVYTYVGSWEVDSGPSWNQPPNGPLAYTGQEAAALLFGGAASGYVISTNGPSVATINNQTWYSVIGYSNAGLYGVELPQDYSSKYLGQFYGPTLTFPLEDPNAAASAYVNDGVLGPTFTNYAFAVSSVPEPSTWAMMILGLGALGFAGYRAARKPARGLCA